MIRNTSLRFAAPVNTLHQKQKTTKPSDSSIRLFKGVHTWGMQAASSVSSVTGRCSRNFWESSLDTKVVIITNVSVVLGIALGMTMITCATYMDDPDLPRKPIDPAMITS